MRRSGKTSFCSRSNSASRANLLADQVVGPLTLIGCDHPGLHRGAAGRQLVDHRDRHLAVEGQGKRARDGRRRHGEEMRPPATFPTQLLALTRSESMLLVDDRKAEVGELDVLLDQRVGADDQRAMA
jgi:hypothetical protein